MGVFGAGRRALGPQRSACAQKLRASQTPSLEVGETQAPLAKKALLGVEPPLGPGMSTTWLSKLGNCNHTCAKSRPMSRPTTEAPEGRNGRGFGTPNAEKLTQEVGEPQSALPEKAHLGADPPGSQRVCRRAKEMGRRQARAARIAAKVAADARSSGSPKRLNRR